MIVLGIETATPVRGVGVVEEERILGEVTLEDSESLFSSLDSLLKEIHIELKDVDGFAISIGPGSFTGLRVGLATAKGLAMVTGRPLLAVPTLDALADSANLILNQVQDQISNLKFIICPILDARKGEVYGCFYRRSTGNPPKADCGTLERVSEYWVLPPKDLIERVERLGEEILFFGTGLEVYRKMISDHLGERVHLLKPNFLAPSPAQVAQIGLRRLQRGEVEDVNHLEPFYIRSSQVGVG